MIKHSKFLQIQQRVGVQWWPHDLGKHTMSQLALRFGPLESLVAYLALDTARTNRPSQAPHAQ